MAKRIISHPTARDTRLDPVLSSECAPQGAGGRCPAVAPPSDHHLVLALGWSDTSNGSLNYDIVFGTPQPVSGPSVLGRLRKGTPPQSWHRPHTQHPTTTTQQSSRAPGLFFETAAVGWLMIWPVGRSNLCFLPFRRPETGRRMTALDLLPPPPLPPSSRVQQCPACSGAVCSESKLTGRVSNSARGPHDYSDASRSHLSIAFRPRCSPLSSFGRLTVQPPNHRPNPPRLHLLRPLQERCLREHARHQRNPGSRSSVSTLPPSTFGLRPALQYTPAQGDLSTEVGLISPLPSRQGSLVPAF